ncbi:MBL fold metallo-hydrolase [Yinghuangia sp. ASG 101]|uniref:MBL fold metallo-hydrolase n=1 Tax=Yinghuangia sp. ASG 101 TaxID=2896848 RepID=UPI001E2C4C09|nr:MBL fold metallo-hydrolase [Yinghuangia sp. ASG 101]UGQ14024.1 MBL fold metallo-hydrolase [Yinghuangia sp. ASG 101]
MAATGPDNATSAPDASPAGPAPTHDDAPDQEARVTATDLGGGVWTIPVPIPDNPLGNTLVYVLESERGPVLVDAGWNDPTSLAALTSGLASLGTSLADVHGVLATHNHPDHHGLSQAVVDASGAWIAMHEADAAQVEMINSSPRAQWLERHLEVLRSAGAPQESLDALIDQRTPPNAVIAKPRQLYATPNRTLVHGELADVVGRDVRVIWTPGHTPGHVCLHLEEGIGTGSGRAGRLLSGDHLLPGITPHIGLYADDAAGGESDPLGDFLASLARVAALPVTGVLPAHQHLFDDAAGRADEIVAFHERRLASLLTQLQTAPRTLWEIAAGMEWNRPWSELGAQNRQVAVSEAAAHLRHLVKRGQAGAVALDDPIRYTTT